MDNGSSKAYFGKPYIFIVRIIQYIIHTHTRTHKQIWATRMFVKMIIQRSKTYKNIVKVDYIKIKC